MVKLATFLKSHYGEDRYIAFLESVHFHTLADVLRFPRTSSVTGQSRSTGVQNYRLIGTGSQILKRLGIEKMRLMSAPVHFNALSGFNLEITEFVQSQDNSTCL